MKSAQVTIAGISALLMHQFPMEPIEGFDKLTMEEQAKHAAYINPDNENLYIPGTALQRAMVNGATYQKKGRATLQKIAAAGLFVSPDRLDLGTKVYAIDSRPVVIPATKGRIIRHRPRLDEWEVSFELEWDDTLLSAKQVRQIVDDTGALVGLLDFRPERKGPFGRFKVSHWNAAK